MASVDRARAAELLNSGPVTAMLAAAAARMADEVRRIAPSKTGAYDRSITVGAPVAGPDGTVVPVETSDPFWHLIEFGSINNEPYAPLRRAATNLRFKLTEAGQ